MKRSPRSYRPLLSAFLCLAALGVVTLGSAAVASAQSQGVSPYEGLGVGDMVSDGSAKLEEMSAATTEVEELRSVAEADEDVSAFQRLDGFWAQMTARVQVAEEALANLRGLRGASKGTKQSGTSPRALAEHNYGLILAAHSSVMTLHRQALAVVGSEATDGEGTTVTGGSEGLPEYDVTSSGATTSPFSAGDLRDNSEFRGRTPSTADIVAP